MPQDNFRRARCPACQSRARRCENRPLWLNGVVNVRSDHLRIGSCVYLLTLTVAAKHTRMRRDERPVSPPHGRRGEPWQAGTDLGPRPSTALTNLVSNSVLGKSFSRTNLAASTSEASRAWEADSPAMPAQWRCHQSCRSSGPCALHAPSRHWRRSFAFQVPRHPQNAADDRPVRARSDLVAIDSSS